MNNKIEQPVIAPELVKLTDAEIDTVTDAQWGQGCAPNQYMAYQDAARAIESAIHTKQVKS
jgi:hypothetical protein